MTWRAGGKRAQGVSKEGTVADHLARIRSSGGREEERNAQRSKVEWSEQRCGVSKEGKGSDKEGNVTDHPAGEGGRGESAGNGMLCGAGWAGGRWHHRGIPGKGKRALSRPWQRCCTTARDALSPAACSQPPRPPRPIRTPHTQHLPSYRFPSLQPRPARPAPPRPAPPRPRTCMLESR